MEQRSANQLRSKLARKRQQVSPQGRTLALDLGKHCTGFATFTGDKLLSYGKINLHVTSDGALFFETYGAINTLIRAHTPDRLVYEYGFAQKGRALECFGVLATAVKALGHKNGLPVFVVYNSQIRRALDANSKVYVTKRVNERFGLELETNTTSEDLNIGDAIGAGVAAQELLKAGKLTRSY